MKSEWTELPLGKIIDLVIDYRGKTPKKLGGDWSNTGYRALSAKNIKTGRIVQTDTIRYVDESLYQKWMKDEVRRGDILITSEAPFGQIFYWDSDEKIVLSQRLFCIRVNPKYDARFIYYYMTTSAFQGELAGRSTGTTVIGLRQPELMKCIIHIPSGENQHRIASILASIDAKISANQKINDNLAEQSQAIFDELFPNISNGSYTIGNYITPKRGKNLLSKNAVQGNVPVVAGGLEPSVYHNISNTKAPVLAISASGANAGYVSLWNIPIWASDSSYIDSSMTNNVYFWYVLLKKRQKEIFDAQTGSAQPHIYPQHIAGMPIKELEVAKIQEFNTMVTPIFEKIGKNLKENTQLETLRDILLPKLMSGEIDISAIQF